MIKVYHLKPLTDEQVLAVNTLGWNASLETLDHSNITAFAKPTSVERAWYSGQYELVADIESADLDTAYRLTNHIDSNWTTNEGVDVKAQRPPRSTSVGDVILVDDAAFVVDRFGFTGIKL